MSLINKMLQDLESRQDVVQAPARPVYQDLRSAHEERERGLSRRWLTMLAIVVIAGAGVFFGMQHFGISLQLESAPTALAKTTPATAPHPAAPAPASAAAVLASNNEPLATQTMVAAVAEPARAAVTPPPARAEPAITKPAKVQPPSVAPPKAVAPKNTVAKKVTTPAVITAPPAPAEEPGSVDKTLRPLTVGEKAETAYREGVRFLEQGRTDDALRVLREALVAQPTHTKARELAAGVALQNGRTAEAQKLLEEGLERVPGQPLFARLLARIYVEQGADEKALVVMESAAARAGDDADFHAFHGALYQRVARHPEAAKAYERAVAKNPNDGRSWLGLAISLEGLQQTEAAVSAYQRARNSGSLTPSLVRYADQRLSALKK